MPAFNTSHPRIILEQVLPVHKVCSLTVVNHLNLTWLVPYSSVLCSAKYVTGCKKTDHFVIMEIVQYGPKALPR